MALRVAASKPMLTIPPFSVEIAIPVFGVAAFVVAALAPVAPTVPVPGLNVNPVPTATCLSVSPAAL